MAVSDLWIKTELRADVPNAVDLKEAKNKNEI